MIFLARFDLSYKILSLTRKRFLKIIVYKSVINVAQFKKRPLDLSFKLIV